MQPPTSFISFSTLIQHPLKVTGSSRGIGAAIAIKLASRGADIAINYHASAAAAEEVAAQVRAQGVRALTVQANVTSQAEVTALFETVVRDLGPLDIVVSNAGVEHFAHISEVTGEDIDRVFDVNVKGQYFVAQQAHKHLKDFGRLMLTASVCAVMVRCLLSFHLPPSLSLRLLV